MDKTAPKAKARSLDKKGENESMDKVSPEAAQKTMPKDKEAMRNIDNKDNTDLGDDNSKIGKEGEKAEKTNDEFYKKEVVVEDLKESFASSCPTFVVSDELGTLLESDDLDAEFKEKFTTVFESAVNSVIKSQHSLMLEGLTNTLEEALPLQEAEIEARVQKYVDYVTEQWVEDNKLAINHGIADELNESIVSEIIAVLESHNIKLDESQLDIVEEERQNRERLEEALEQAVDKGVVLKEQLSDASKQLALMNFSQKNGLNLVESEKLVELSKDTLFEDTESFSRKLGILMENFLKPQAQEDKSGSESITEDLQGNVKPKEDLNESKVSPNKKYADYMKSVTA